MLSKNKKASQNFGTLSVLIAAALWGCIGLFTRTMFSESVGFSPVQSVAVRAFFTMFIMLIVILIKDPKLLKISLKDIWIFLGTGLFSFMFFNICYMTSIDENSLSVACILMYTSPIWVTVISIPLFKEKLNTHKVISLILCFGGAVMTCLSSSLVLTQKGLIFGLLSGVGYALYSIFGKFATGKYHTLTIIFYTFLFATIGVLPFSNAKGIIILFEKPVNILLSVGVSVFCTILPYLFYTYGLSKIPVPKAAVISILEPIVATLVGLFFYSEIPSLIGYLGIVTVVFGLIYLEKGADLFRVNKNLSK